MTAFAFSDNSEIFASGSDDRTINVWNFKDGLVRVHSFEDAHTGTIIISYLLNVKKTRYLHSQYLQMESFSPLDRMITL